MFYFYFYPLKESYFRLFFFFFLELDTSVELALASGPGDWNGEGDAANDPDSVEPTSCGLLAIVDAIPFEFLLFSRMPAGPRAAHILESSFALDTLTRKQAPEIGSYALT